MNTSVTTRLASLFIRALILAAPLGAQTLPSGVASGDVTQHSAVVWTRSIAPGPLMFEYGVDPAFQTGVRRTFAWVTLPQRPVKRLLFPLASGERYFYRVTDAAGSRIAGTFVTPAYPGQRTGLRFGVTGDSRGDQAPFPSVTNIPARRLDFLALLGDTIYADIESPALPGVPQAESLEEFRAKHAEVLSEVDGLNALARVRRSTPLLATIDDHEVTNDFAGGAHPSTDGRFDDTGEYINETMLYAAGLRAFQEYHPLRNRYYGNTGDSRTAFKRRLYRSRFYGSDAAVMLLDARSFRDEGLVPADLADPVDIARFIIESFDPTRTMLGREQVEDLKADLLQAQQLGVTWKFVMVPEPIQNLGVALASDRFEGYAAERTEILAHITENSIENVVFVAADIHGTLVNNLQYQLGPGTPQIDTSAFEVTTGAIAFDAPFGPTVVEIALQLGLISQTEYDLYLTLPLADKDVFVTGLVDTQVLFLGYDPIGLDGSGLQATLITGGYAAVHTYGWTEFEIDAATGNLTVTTYAVEPSALDTPPFVVSQFVVEPR